MVSNTTVDERRYFRRASWTGRARIFPLSLESLSAVPSIQDVTSQDISEGGIQVRSAQMVPIHSRLLVELESSETSAWIQAVGSVAWISPAMNQEPWCLGIEFSDVGDLALAGIRHIVDEADPANP
ncbi:PilZ domain-containing protein [Allochromatium palmeri]|uniref:PilZ domain-containing protein n=1 Tax=Allochromatium palmeri TaxID=231048 RepID=A0A6N8E9C2_9GAMM|nr:PilZ domain-containing protein [Allochromatium palmeri]MTW20735.1 PilZ domain-containing protein [Allochromatium palmeri]